MSVSLSTKPAVAGATVTVFTGASVTVTEDVPVFVSLVAVIVVAPAATAVTRPLASTVAAAVLLEVHVTTRPLSTLFAASRSVAVSCCVGVIPTTRLAEDGVTVTVLTGASVTVIEDVPVFVSLVAVIVVAPAPTAVDETARIYGRCRRVARGPGHQPTSQDVIHCVTRRRRQLLRRAIIPRTRLAETESRSLC